MNVSQKKKEL